MRWGGDHCSGVEGGGLIGYCEMGEMGDGPTTSRMEVEAEWCLLASFLHAARRLCYTDFSTSHPFCS